jgi:hypothetical protein
VTRILDHEQRTLRKKDTIRHGTWHLNSVQCHHTGLPMRRGSQKAVLEVRVPVLHFSNIHVNRNRPCKEVAICYLRIYGWVTKFLTHYMMGCGV